MQTKEGKDQNTILIVGSKPIETLPLANKVYFANYASSYHKERLHKHQENYIVTAIRSAGSIGNPRIIDLIDNNHIRSVFCVGAIRERQFRTDLAETIHADLASKVNIITQSEKQEILGKITGTKEPICNFPVSKLGLINASKAWLSTIKNAISVTLSEENQHSGFARISTGVFTLVYAIHQNGAQKKYVLAGVGAGNRGSYLDGNRDFTGRSKLFNGADFANLIHSYADIKVLRTLTNKYDIEIIDDELKNEVLSNY